MFVKTARLFLLGDGGTSFSHHPLPLDQYQLGTPFHLSAYGVGEARGDHYWIRTVSMVREIGRMPDCLGGPCTLVCGLKTVTRSIPGTISRGAPT